MKGMLELGLKTFYCEIKEHLDDKLLSQKEKEQFMKGLFFALDAMTRLAILKIALTPFEREIFIQSAKTWIFNEACERTMQTSEMTEKSKSGWPEIAFCLMAAKELNDKLGLSLSEEEKLQLENAVAMAKRKS